MKKLLIIILLILVGGYFIFVPPKKKDATLRVANHAPYTVKLSYAFGMGEKYVQVNGWFELGPGESKEFTHEYRSKKPQFFVHAQSADPNMIRWIFDLDKEDEGIMYFDGDFDASFFHTFSEPFTYEVTNYDPYEFMSSPEISEDAMFGFAATSMDEQGNSVHIIYDDTFADFLSFGEIQNSTSYLDSIKPYAKALSASLYRQFEFDTLYPNPTYDFMYHFGISLDDQNGFSLPGIAITELNRSITIDGGELPYQEQDMILSINGRTVYSFGDLHMYLRDHAWSLSAGIKKPIQMTLIRNDQVLSVQTSYFFNQGYFGRNEQEERTAVMYGAADTFFYGMASSAVSAGKAVYNTISNVLNDENKKMDYQLEKWRYEQKEERLKQFYNDEFSTGGIVAMFTSPAQLFRKSGTKAIRKMGLSKKNSLFLSTVGIEVAEGVVWSYNTTPVIASEQDKIDKVVGELPLFLGVGVISGALSRNSRL